MKLFFCRILIGMLLICGTMLSAKEIAARLNYRICVPDQPTLIEVTAAEELTAYLKKTYTENIRLNGSEKPILFSVGFAPEAREFTKTKDALTSSGFGVFCRKRTVLLTGLDDPEVRPYSGFEEGTLLSVYYFLRRYTGLKIYAPDPVHGEKTGKNTELNIPSENKPQFSFSVRGIGKSFADVTTREMNRYARKQLCHDFYWTNTNLYYTVLNRWGKRFKNQPEMLGLYKGKRQSIKYPYHLPCLTNPDVREVIVNDILEMIRKRKIGDCAVLRIFCDAPFQRCECANCARIASNDDYFYGFIVSVRDAVRKHYPKTRLFLQEKGKSHNSPPSSGDLKDVVVDISTGFPDKADYRKNQELFRKWIDRGALPTIRLYTRYPQWLDCPIINPHDVAANFRAMKGLALGQRRSDCTAYRKNGGLPYAFAALTNFVHVNCLLNADSDPDELIRDFCSFMYPGAAGEMIAFYDWMEKRQKNLGANDNPYLKCYSYKSLDYPLSLLEKAAKKCTDPFWLNKLRIAFDTFREQARKIQHLTVHLDKNLQLIEQQKAQFKKQFSQPFLFSSEKIGFPLCPIDAPLSEIQDSFVRVHVENDRLVFQFTAMEKHPEMIRRAATRKKPDPIWGDDNFELMIASKKQNGMPYLQLVINANGAVSALWYSQSEEKQPVWSPAENWRAAAEIGKDRWTAGLSVPLSLIRKICPDGKGRIGIFRNRVLSHPDPKLRGLFSSHSGLDAETPSSGDHHNISRYHLFTLK